MAWSLKKRVIASCSVGWVITILGVVMIPVLEWVIEKKVKETVVIRTDSKVYKYWHEPPVPVYMQIYIFNLTNRAEFLQGDKPVLSQKGPYTYREVRVKEDIVWNDNGTVTYRQKRSFYFLPEMSPGCDENRDIFITPNPVYWALYRALRFEDGRVREILNDLTELFGADVLMERSAREIVWGYVDPVLKVAKTIDPNWFYTDFVGYFMNKNDTNDGVYTIYTGADDINQLGLIDKYNGSSYLDFWSTPWANMVNGSDGTLGPPYLNKDRLMYSFASDVCRSVAGIFAKDVKTPQGIGLWRFEAPPSYVANASVTPDNIGYCTPGVMEHCLGAGIYNVTSCQSVDSFNLPTAISFPHFLYADPKYINAVGGMHPNAEEHKVTIDLEPFTGLVLQAAKRLQVNLHMLPIPNISHTLKIKEVYMPIFWLNESAAIDQKNSDELYSMLFTPLHIIHVMEAVAISLGVAIILVTVLFGVKIKVNQSKQVRSRVTADLRDDETSPLVPGLSGANNPYTHNGSLSSRDSRGASLQQDTDSDN